MTKQSGLDEALFVGGYDLSGDVGSAQSLKKSHGEQDTTGIDKSAIERQLLLGDGEIGFANYFNDSAVAPVGLHAVLANLVYADRIISYFMGAVLGAVTASMQGKQVNYDLDRGNDGAVNGGAITCKSNGYGLEYGYALTDADVDEDGTVDTGLMTIGVTQATKTYLRVGGTSFLTTGLQVGDRVTITGFVDGASNGTKNITEVTSTYFVVAEATGINEAGTGNEQVVMASHHLEGLDGDDEGFTLGSDGTLVMYAHILALTGAAGNDVILSIEHSDDDGVADPYAAVTGATTGIVDIAAIPYAVRVEVDGPIKRWIRVKVATDSGYSTVTFAVCAIRNGPATV